MEAVSLGEARAIHNALLHAKRFLHHDGVVRLAVTLKSRDTGGVARDPIGRQLVLCDTVQDGTIEVVAAVSDFVTRVSDGRLFYVLEVSIVDGKPLFTVEEPKPWRLPCPPPHRWMAANDARQTKPITLSSDEIDLAAEYSTFNQMKYLIVMPITKGTGQSYAQLLGATPLHCVSTAMERAEEGSDAAPEAVASRRATHFFSWSFAQQIGRYVAAYSAFVADNGLDPKTVYTWISPLSEDQYGSSDYGKEEWAGIFERRLHDIGHLVLLFSPWYDAAPLGRIWCLWELFIAATSDEVTITVQLPPQDEATLTSALLHSEISVSMLIKGISTQKAEARDPEAKAMIRAHIKEHGGHEAVDKVIRKQLESALVIESKSSAVSAASRSELRAIVLTEGQGELVRRIFYDIEEAAWRRGRWHLNVPASSGKSYIAVHLVGQWAHEGEVLYICHHIRMQQLVVKQVKLELQKNLRLDPKLELAEECVGVEGRATWVRTPTLCHATPASLTSCSVLVATIDGVIDLAVIDLLTKSPCIGFDRSTAARIASFLRGASPDLTREAVAREARRARAETNVIEHCPVLIVSSALASGGDERTDESENYAKLSGRYMRTTIEVGGATLTAWRFEGNGHEEGHFESDGVAVNDLYITQSCTSSWEDAGCLILGSLSDWVKEADAGTRDRSLLCNSSFVESGVCLLAPGEASTTDYNTSSVFLALERGSQVAMSLGGLVISAPHTGRGDAKSTDDACSLRGEPSDRWGDYARLVCTCLFDSKWRGRFRGGIAVDEGHLVCGREARANVAGQHRLPAAAVRNMIECWADPGGLAENLGRLVVLGDENQLNVNPHDARAIIAFDSEDEDSEDEDSGEFDAERTPDADVEERALHAAWPIAPPVYPRGCILPDSLSSAVNLLLQTNLRNSHTVRDSAAMLYHEFKRDGTLQPLHASSAYGRELQAIDVVQSRWSGARLRIDDEEEGEGEWRWANAVHASAEDYAVGVATALVELRAELCGSVGGTLPIPELAMDRPMIAVLTPYDNEEWGGTRPEQDEFNGESDEKFGERLAQWNPATRGTFRDRLRAATIREVQALEKESPSANDFAFMLADGVAPPWLVWETAENFVGLDIPLVIMAGFDPMGKRNNDAIASASWGNYEQNRRNPLAYMAMTRATYGTVIVEPHAVRFARHYRIRATSSGAFVAETTATEEKDYSGGSPKKMTLPLAAADPACSSVAGMTVIVDQYDGRTRLFSNSVRLNGQGLTYFPLQLVDPLRVGTLRAINLVCNSIAALPDSILRLTALEKLNLQQNNITELPPEFGELLGLVELNLSANRLTTLPDTMSSLAPKLKMLDLGHNYFAGTLPTVIGTLTGLEALDLNNNELSELIPSMSALTELKSLLISANKLRAVPEEIASMTRLAELHINGNALRELPTWIGTLTELKVLSLDENQLTTLPVSISKLTGLRELSLSSNKLSELPKEIVALMNLRNLDLRGNEATFYDTPWIQEWVDTLVHGDCIKTGDVSCDDGEW